MSDIEIEPSSLCQPTNTDTQHIAPSYEPKHQNQQLPPSYDSNLSILPQHQRAYQPVTIPTDLSPINQTMIQLFSGVLHKIPDANHKSSQNKIIYTKKQFINCKLITCLTIFLMMSIIISLCGCYLMIKYDFITVKLTSTTKFDAQKPRGVSAQAPIINNTQPAWTPNPLFPYIQDGWLHFDRPKQAFYFTFNSVNQIVFNYSSIVPKQANAKFIKMTIFFNSFDSLQGGYDFDIKTRVVNRNKQIWVHWNRGTRWNQTAAAYNSEEFIVPCSDNQEIRFQTWRKQINAGLVYAITGYLPGTN